MATLTIILTDGPYISECAEMAVKIAKAALVHHRVNIFLYLDAVHIPKGGQNPVHFVNIGRLFEELASNGATIRACPRCAAARGYQAAEGVCQEYLPGIRITSLYDLAEMLKESDKVIALSR
ncbi:MAG: DsrE family protein [Methanothrix sp.]|nr:DsrE family protein [Methanothrix sp.]